MEMGGKSSQWPISGCDGLGICALGWELSLHGKISQPTGNLEAPKQ